MKWWESTPIHNLLGPLMTPDAIASLERVRCSYDISHDDFAHAVQFSPKGLQHSYFMEEDLAKRAGFTNDTQRWAGQIVSHATIAYDRLQRGEHSNLPESEINELMSTLPKILAAITNFGDVMPLLYEIDRSSGVMLRSTGIVAEIDKILARCLG